jgi:hypothetical protein
MTVGCASLVPAQVQVRVGGGPAQGPSGCIACGFAGGEGSLLRNLACARQVQEPFSRYRLIGGATKL